MSRPYKASFDHVLKVSNLTSAHRPSWSTEQPLRRSDAYFRLNSGICSVTSNMLEPSGTQFALFCMDIMPIMFLIYIILTETVLNVSDEKN